MCGLRVPLRGDQRRLTPQLSCLMIQLFTKTSLKATPSRKVECQKASILAGYCSATDDDAAARGRPAAWKWATARRRDGCHRDPGYSIIRVSMMRSQAFIYARLKFPRPEHITYGLEVMGVREVLSVSQSAKNSRPLSLAMNRSHGSRVEQLN